MKIRRVFLCLLVLVLLLPSSISAQDQDFQVFLPFVVRPAPTPYSVHALDLVLRPSPSGYWLYYEGPGENEGEPDDCEVGIVDQYVAFYFGNWSAGRLVLSSNALVFMTPNAAHEYVVCIGKLPNPHPDFTGIMPSPELGDESVGYRYDMIVNSVPSTIYVVVFRVGNLIGILVTMDYAIVADYERSLGFAGQASDAVQEGISQ